MIVYPNIERAAQQAVAMGLQGLWQGLALTLLVALLLRFHPRLNAATRYAIWAATLLAVFCLPLLQGMGGEKRVDLKKRLESAVYASAEELVDPVLARRPVPGAEWVQSLDSFRGMGFQLPKGTWALLVVGLWAVAAAVLMARLAAGYLYMRRLRQESKSLPVAYQRRLRHWSHYCGLRRAVRLRSSPAISTPVVVGLLHPVVLIPEAMVGVLSAEELDQVYLHELAHIRRWDDWSNLVQKVIAALCCFFPVVWWIGRRLDLEREIACDDWVVAQTGKSCSYAVCLTRLLELSTGSRLPVLASGAIKRRGQIAIRIALLLDRRRNRTPGLSRKGVMGMLVVLCLGMGALSACDNPFAPPEYLPGPGQQPPPAPAATSPEILIDNLHQAMNDRNKDLYEELIDEDFWFTEFDCRGDLVMANGREEELEIMGTRDGSDRGILNRFRIFEFAFIMSEKGRSTELGRDYPEAFPGDPDGHPDEDWEVFRGRVEMLMIDDEGDGYRVVQTMTYKLRQTEEGLWKIIRWDDDPLSGDCGTAKPVVGYATWREVKAERR